MSNLGMPVDPTLPFLTRNQQIAIASDFNNNYKNLMASITEFSQGPDSIVDRNNLFNRMSELVVRSPYFDLIRF